MSKMSSEPGRQALSGPTMGTRWSALFHTTGAFDPAPVRAMWSDFLGGQRKWHTHLWSVLMFQAWKDAWR